MMLSGELSMKSDVFSSICGGGLFNGVEISNVNPSHFVSNSRTPFIAKTGNSLVSGGIILAYLLVSRILRWCGITKIAPSIVKSVSVLVVNKHGSLDRSQYKPREKSRAISTAIPICLNGIKASHIRRPSSLPITVGQFIGNIEIYQSILFLSQWKVSDRRAYWKECSTRLNFVFSHSLIIYQRLAHHA